MWHTHIYHVFWCSGDGDQSKSSRILKWCKSVYLWCFFLYHAIAHPSCDTHLWICSSLFPWIYFQARIFAPFLFVKRFKSFCGGCFLSFPSYLTKKRNKDILTLENEIKEVEIKHSNGKDDVTLQQLNRTKLKVGTLHIRADEISWKQKSDMWSMETVPAGY